MDESSKAEIKARNERHVPWLTILIVIIADYLLFTNDFQRVERSRFLLSCIAPLVLITSSSILELRPDASFTNRALREWRLVSPLLLFGVSELFMLLPINDANFTAFGNSIPSNPHGVQAVIIYGLGTLTLAIGVAVFWLAITVPFMYSSLLKDGWGNTGEGWWNIVITFMSAILGLFFWDLILLVRTP